MGPATRSSERAPHAQMLSASESDNGRLDSMLKRRRLARGGGEERRGGG